MRIIFNMGIRRTPTRKGKSHGKAHIVVHLRYIKNDMCDWEIKNALTQKMRNENDFTLI